MSMHPERNLFKEFPNPYYVESGAYAGDSIQLAIDAGFIDIRAIEIDSDLVRQCRKRFVDQPVSVFEGDSSEILWDVIEDIEEPITFWLDAHTQYLEGEQEGEHPWPLFHELAQIIKHPIKTHTIMIDDILILTHKWTTGWDYEEIKARLYLINPDYKLELFANPVKNNLLVAHV